MGKTEDLLKEYILSKYRSIREFTIDTGMPYSTLDTILKRGIRNASIDNILKICQTLGISTDALVNGKIEPVYNETQTLAAHFDGDEYTEEELNEIQQFAEFVKNKRK